MVKLTVGPLFIERNAYKNPDARTHKKKALFVIKNAKT